MAKIITGRRTAVKLGKVKRTSLRELYYKCLDDPDKPDLFNRLVEDLDLTLKTEGIVLHPPCKRSLKILFGNAMNVALARWCVINKVPWKLWLNIPHLVSWCRTYDVPWLSLNDFPDLGGHAMTMKTLRTPPCPWDDCP